MHGPYILGGMEGKSENAQDWRCSYFVSHSCVTKASQNMLRWTRSSLVVGKCGELNVVSSWLHALNFTFWEEAVQIGVKYWGSYVDTYRERYIFGWYVGESRSGKRTPKRHMLRWDWTMCSEYMLITNLGSVAVIIGRGMCKCIAFGESSLWTFGTFPASQLR